MIMKDNQLYINSYVRLTNEFLIVDRKTLAENDGMDAKEWLSFIYKELNLNYPKFFKMDALCKSGFLASEAVMRKEPSAEIREDWAVVCLGRAGSLDDDRNYQETIQLKENYYPSPSVFVYTLANIVTGELAIRHRIQGESSCYICERFDAKLLIQIVQDVFANTSARHILCGWVDYDAACIDVLLTTVSSSEKESVACLDISALSDFYGR